MLVINSERSPGMSAQRGFTLIELMMVLVILAVLLLVAAPSFQESIQRNRLQSTLSSIVSMLSFSRGEAVTRGAPVSVCASTDGAACGGSDWEEGWIVFVDDGAGAGTAQDGVLNGAELTLRTGQAAPNDVTLRVRNFPQTTHITFVGNGRLEQNTDGTFVICDGRGADFARAVVVNVSGQARFATSDPNDPSGDLADDDGTAITTCT